MKTSTTFTQLETQVIEQFIGELYAEPGFSDVSPQDLEIKTTIPMRQLRGVLGSLTTKGVIFIEDKRNIGTDMDIVYLNEDFYHLHPEWKDC